MRYGDAELNTFWENITSKMGGNPGYADPAVPIPDLTAAGNTFSARLAASHLGGIEATAQKNAARVSLENLLRIQASYVQSVAGSNLPLLLSSGFESTSQNRAQVQLIKPEILRIINSQSTFMRLKVSQVPTAMSWEVRISLNNLPPQTVGIFTSARRILIPNLTPGVVYTVQVRAIGGSTGYSDWSDPVSHMAT